MSCTRKFAGERQGSCLSSVFNPSVELAEGTAYNNCLLCGSGRGFGFAAAAQDGYSPVITI